jgi:hypothetical protein
MLSVSINFAMRAPELSFTIKSKAAAWCSSAQVVHGSIWVGLIILMYDAGTSIVGGSLIAIWRVRRVLYYVSGHCSTSIS